MYRARINKRRSGDERQRNEASTFNKRHPENIQFSNFKMVLIEHWTLKLRDAWWLIVEPFQNPTSPLARKSVMKLLLFPFTIIAGAGFLLSLAAHLLALNGKSLPVGGWIWMLHVGIFAVWLPAILINRRKGQNSLRKEDLGRAMNGAPRWMRGTLLVVFVYALFNFALFMGSTIGQSRGHKKDRSPAPPAVIRGFSGHWMVFYGAAFVTFYSALRRSKRGQDRLGWDIGRSEQDSTGIPQGSMPVREGRGF